MSIKWALVLMVGGVSISSRLAAQVEAGNAELVDKFQLNQRIRVSVAGAQVAGTFQGVRNDSISVLRDGITERIALDQVLGVWQRGRATKTGAIVGGVVGVGLGVFVGLIGAAFACDDGVQCTPWSYPLAGGAVGAGIGAGLGAVVGAAIPKWKKVSR